MESHYEIEAIARRYTGDLARGAGNYGLGDLLVSIIKIYQKRTLS